MKSLSDENTQNYDELLLIKQTKLYIWQSAVNSMIHLNGGVNKNSKFYDFRVSIQVKGSEFTNTVKEPIAYSALNNLFKLNNINIFMKCHSNK